MAPKATARANHERRFPGHVSVLAARGEEDPA
jgi:hypothetical protein